MSMMIDMKLPEQNHLQGGFDTFFLKQKVFLEIRGRS